MLLLIFAVIATLVAVNAFYVGAEFSLVSVRKSAIKQLAVEGDRLARGLLPLLEDSTRLDRAVATCQIGITVSSLVLGAFAELTLGTRLTPIVQSISSLSWETSLSISVVLILIALTALQMVIGELVPKSIALLYPARLALLLYIPLQWSTLSFTWFISLLNGSAVVLLRMLGFEASGPRHIHTSEELAFLLAQVREGGALEADEHARLHRALRLDVWSAAELMVPRRSVQAIDRSASPEEVQAIVANSPYTRLPVYEGAIDNVTMLLHTKDVVAELALKGRITDISPLLKPLIAVPEVMKTDQLLNLMRRKRVQMVSVIDEYGTFIGIVTVEDILSEVFGDVGDEFKEGQPVPEVLDDGRVRLPGHMRPDEAEPWIGTLWEGDSNTISGLVTEALKTLPSPGDRVTIQNVEVEVEQVIDRVVRSVLAKPVTRNPEVQV